MSYRSPAARCTICHEGIVIANCLRCDRWLCLEHVPPNDRRCEHCERELADAAPYVQPPHRWVSTAAVVSWLTVSFLIVGIASGGRHGETVKYVGLAVLIVQSLLLWLMHEGPSLAGRVRRRRFLAERPAT